MASRISFPLASGPKSIPAIGLGTWQAQESELEEALDYALSIGYRHIDTAWVYDNEEVIGNVLQKWFDDGKLTREEIFITTKLPLYGNRPEEVEKYLIKSLHKLKLGHVDLYLIHVPFGYIKTGDKASDWTMDPSTNIKAIWQEMERQHDLGRTRHIGVSNFNISQVQRLLEIARIHVSCNQVEIHAYLQQPELVSYMKQHGVVVVAYSPLGSKGTTQVFKQRGIEIKTPDLMHDPLVQTLAKKYNKTPAQILLRHIVQSDLVAIPKSTNKQRLRENIEIFDFELESNDMEALNQLDRNERILDFKIFKGCETHPEYPFLNLENKGFSHG